MTSGRSGRTSRWISACVTRSTRRSSVTPPKGGQMTYDPDNNTVRVAGYGDVPETLGVKTYWKNFNPRTGHFLAH